MSDHESCEPQTPEQELEVARKAADMDDFAHAMSHLAGALAHDPSWGEAREFLDALLARCFVDPLETVPLEADGPTYFGTVALRAYVLAHQDERAQALNLLTMVIASQGLAQYLVWVEEWFSRPGWLEGLSADDVEPLCRCAYGDLGPAGHARLAAVLQRVCEVHPKAEWPAYGLLVATRKAGDPAGAAALGEELVQHVPSYLTWLGLAAARREADDLEGAIEANRKALTLPREDDVGARLDIGDMCIALERWDEAQTAFEEVLERDPESGWAQGSLPYVVLKRDRDPKQLRMLTKLTHAGNQRAAELLDEIAPAGFPGSSVLNGVLHSLEAGHVITRSACSSLEPPSAMLACRRVLTAFGADPDGFEVSFGEIPEPDPRVAWGELSHPALWRYDGTQASPAVEPPRPDVLAAVAQATADRRRPKPAGDPADVIEHLMRCMVHVPPEPDGHHPAWWIYGVQAGCGSAIGALNADWETVRFPALKSLLRGPVDWTTAVAVRTLDGVARRDPALREAIDAELIALIDRPSSPIWFMCAVQPVAGCFLAREEPHPRAADLLERVL